MEQYFHVARDSLERVRRRSNGTAKEEREKAIGQTLYSLLQHLSPYVLAFSSSRVSCYLSSFADRLSTVLYFRICSPVVRERRWNEVTPSTTSFWII